MSNSGVLTDSFVLKFNGSGISAQAEMAVQSVVVEQTWSAADRIEIRFDDTDEAAPTVKIGDAVKAEIVTDTSVTVLFDGEITAIGFEFNYNTRTLVFEGYDKRHRLTRQIEPTSFETSKLSDVVSAIASRNGTTSTVPAVFQRTVFPTMIVAGSDFAILQHISHLTGCPWAFAESKIVFDDPTASKTPATKLTADDLTDFDLRFTPIESAESVEVTGWDPKLKKTIVGKVTSLPKSRHQPGSLVTTDRLEQKTARAWGSRPMDSGDADDQANSVGQRLRDTEVTGRGATTGNPKIKPGVMIEIDGVSPRVNGKYVISSARHVYGGSWGSLMTHFRIGPADAGLADLLMTPTGSSNPLTRGVTIGIVTQIENKDDSSAPPAVRLKLPMLGDKVETGWARLLSHGSGTGRGIVFPPEVGDEVLVAFEHGDINHPYVLGTVWNDAGNSFADTIKSNVADERRIVSKLSNQLRFIDIKSGDDKSGISLEADAAKTKLFFGYKETTIETKDRPFNLKNGKASIVLDNDEITITANKITLKSASGDVVIDANNVDVKAKAKFSATANSEVMIKSSAQATVQAGAIMTVKGSMVKVN